MKIKLSPRAKRNCDWIEANLYVPDGKLVGRKVVLSDAQKKWFEMIYGSPTRTFICSIPRKNAKTTTCAMIVLLHLVGPEFVHNGQLFSAAQSRDQAAILFSLAAKMVRLSKELSTYVGIRDTAKQLYCTELGTLYRALSADASTAYGLSPCLVIHDELGQVKGARSELYEALETASGAQESPLSIIISTQAPTDADLLSVLIDDAMGDDSPDNVKCVLYTVPIDADVFDKKVIAAAQPNWHLMNHDEVFKSADNAKRMPSSESSYRNLICNQRVEARSPFVSRSVWLENGDIPAELEGLSVYCGLDLSSTQDLTALVMVSIAGDVHCRFWLPEEGLFEKSLRDRVTYDVWAKNGDLLTTPGRSIEYEHVADYLKGIFDFCDIKQIAFDRWNMKFLRPWLVKSGFSDEQLERFVEFGQGTQSMSPAIRDLESRLLQKKLKHGNHPVLTMCAANAVTVADKVGWPLFHKQKSTGRIDGMQALAMAVGVMPQDDYDAQLTNYLMNAII